MSVATDAEQEYFERAWHAWRLRHRDLARDPHEAFIAGTLVGAAETIRYSARWAGLVPAMRDQTNKLEQLTEAMEYVEAVYSALFSNAQP